MSKFSCRLFYRPFGFILSDKTHFRSDPVMSVSCSSAKL